MTSSESVVHSVDLLCHAMLCRAMLCYAVLCHALPWLVHAMHCYSLHELCYSLLFFELMCYAKLTCCLFAMLCYAVPNI